MASIDEKLLNVLSDVSQRVNNPFKDKWISILGDSISTYDGWIPEGNAIYYPKDDVNDVSKTWWHILLTKLGAKLCVNESWGGRLMCEAKTSTKAAYNAVNKLHRIKGNTYINLDGTTTTATENINPDVILVFVGINDFNGGVALGDITSCKPSYSMNTATSFIDSYNAFLCSLVGTYYKNAQCYLMEPAYISNIGFQEKNTSNNYLSEFQAAVRHEAEIVGLNCIHISKIAVHAGNSTINLIQTDKIHPKAIMMEKIANQCYSEMMASNCL